MVKSSKHRGTRGRSPLFEVRFSRIHGHGVVALEAISGGRRVIEYQGERITPEEADRRYDDDGVEHPHVLLFSLDETTLIDAGRGGNEARFINHSCEPNCESVSEEGRIYIEAVQEIIPGEELTYDYNIEFEGRRTAKARNQYACHCGASTCRGTMLAPRRKRRRSAKKEG